MENPPKRASHTEGHNVPQESAAKARLQELLHHFHHAGPDEEKEARAVSLGAERLDLQKTEASEYVAELSAKLRGVQLELQKLNEQFKTIAPRVFKGEESALELNRVIGQKIEEKHIEEKDLREKLEKAGGNPSDYTLQ